MKQVVLVWLLLLSIFSNGFPQGTDELWDKLDQFFWAYTEDGKVAYSVVQKHQIYLDELTESFADFDENRLTDAEARKAFWINAYNVFVIRSVIEHYPVQSPRDVYGFFNTRRHRVAGQLLTLDEIEKRKLRAEYSDARIHFALVCAAASCPPLISEAYRPGKLDSQLDRQTRKFVNDSAFVRWDRESDRVLLSKIFKWYGTDFTQNASSVIAFINQYREQPIPEAASIAYMPYDWSLNNSPQPNLPTAEVAPQSLQSYTPSTLLSPGQLEIKQFNNVYTQTAFFDEEGNHREDNFRSTYYTGILNILYGEAPRVNIGIDIFFKSVRVDDRSSKFINVFRFAGEPSSRTALASIAPKLKVAPFASLPRLALQTALVIPVVSDLEGRNNNKPFLDYDALQWWTQIFYDYSLNTRWLIYLETGAFFRFESNRTDFVTPVKFFLNFYPSQRWTLYLPLELTPTWQSGGGWASYYTQVGGGIKYLISSFIELEALYTVFPAGKNNGAGQTYNLGLRIIR